MTDQTHIFSKYKKIFVNKHCRTNQNKNKSIKQCNEDDHNFTEKLANDENEETTSSAPVNHPTWEENNSMGKEQNKQYATVLPKVGKKCLTNC